MSNRAARVRSILDTELDWNLLSDGSHHGVLPLVYENLRRISPEKVPEVWLVSLESSLRQKIICSLEMLAELSD